MLGPIQFTIPNRSSLGSHRALVVPLPAGHLPTNKCSNSQSGQREAPPWRSSTSLAVIVPLPEANRLPASVSREKGAAPWLGAIGVTVTFPTLGQRFAGMGMGNLWEAQQERTDRSLGLAWLVIPFLERQAETPDRRWACKLSELSRS